MINPAVEFISPLNFKSDESLNLFTGLQSVEMLWHIPKLGLKLSVVLSKKNFWSYAALRKERKKKEVRKKGSVVSSLKDVGVYWDGKWLPVSVLG